MKKIIVVENTKKNKSLMYKSWNSKSSTKYIILTTIPVIIRQVTAVLDVPDGNLKKGKKASDILTACTDNKWVTVDPAFLIDLGKLIASYNSQTVPSERDAAWVLVHAKLKKLMSFFQDGADAAPADAISIIESGDFRVKKIRIPKDQIFKATNGIESGVIDLVAQGGGSYTCHDWWYSADGVAFERMQPTIAAKTQKTGLKPLTLAYFMHELITKKGGAGMSEIIKIQVK